MGPSSPNNLNVSKKPPGNKMRLWKIRTFIKVLQLIQEYVREQLLNTNRYTMLNEEQLLSHIKEHHEDIIVQKKK